MYMHAHLRYAEALARFGDAPGLFAALAKVVPVGITDRVEQARPRQSTTYYSSSDGVFADRSDAPARYADLMRGEVALEGGWRVYSSGPGLFLRLVTETLLGCGCAPTASRSTRCSTPSRRPDRQYAVGRQADRGHLSGR